MDSMSSGFALCRSWRADKEAQEKWSEPQKRMRSGSEILGGNGRISGSILGAVSVVTICRAFWKYIFGRREVVVR